LWAIKGGLLRYVRTFAPPRPESRRPLGTGTGAERRPRPGP
jgi:hypothetical protein